MTDKQIVEYVKRIIVYNLDNNDCQKEAILINFDNTNKLLLEHIIGLIALFKKAKGILEKENDNE